MVLLVAYELIAYATSALWSVVIPESKFQVPIKSRNSRKCQN